MATAGIGLLPTYAAIGIAAPVLLVTLRIAQGFSVGGEAAGAMTFLAEHAPDGQRGRITSYAQIASFARPAHRHAGRLRHVAVAHRRPRSRAAASAAFAWRIPFLVAIPMGVIGCYIRKRISDTPNFIELKEEGGLSHNPLKEAFATPEHRRAMLLALFIPLMNGSGYYVLFSYMPTFLKSKQIGFTTGTALLVTASSLVAICDRHPVHGHAVGPGRPQAGHRRRRDRHGGRGHPLLRPDRHRQRGTRHPRRLHHGRRSSPATPRVIHILIVELFPTRVRYSAYGLGYNISSALFGGTAPLLMTLAHPESGNSTCPPSTPSSPRSARSPP